MTARVEATRFGTMPDGSPAHLYTLTNAHGLVARVTDYGATLTALSVPDHTGRLADVVLGFDHLYQYLQGHPYFGSTVGRVANRIGHGRFVLDGQPIQLALNHREHHLHGGPVGFDKVLWHSEPLDGAVRFTHVSPDGDQGYPGQLEVAVTMTLTDADALIIDYEATTDRPTPVNLTNHAWFNLAGAGDILGHVLWLAADGYTPTDADLIPTGEVLPVAGTPLDFSRPVAIGARIVELGGDPPGYDHNYVLGGAGKGLAVAARLTEPVSGRVLEVATTEPGLQLYTGNYLDGTITGKGGVAYPRYAGLCLEAQGFPDAVNHPGFPGVILRPGQTYRQTTALRFAVRPE
ncbi:MAG TPA: aldose epimerase family protein [Gemmatimonadales bacterium]